ncbi:MAG: ribosome assembly RNA-binding protein YhbY [Legionellaceae bacterium]|nr:ribosome assembly RNA-binding protein YhbY [Legionellaceae bacterium]
MKIQLKKALKAQAHHLNPVILIGSKGLSPTVIAETDSALETHELIKIKIADTDRENRKSIAIQLCEATSAECIQSIGKIFVLYRLRSK